jgi:hypothetical protein
MFTSFGMKDLTIIHAKLLSMHQVCLETREWQMAALLAAGESLEDIPPEPLAESVSKKF